MTKTIMKAVGAVAAGRNRKVHMRIASVTIYCDEGSKGSNPALSAELTGQYRTVSRQVPQIQ